MHAVAGFTRRSREAGPVTLSPGQAAFPLHSRSPAKSQGSGKELSVELQILSHLGTGSQTLRDTSCP